MTGLITWTREARKAQLPVLEKNMMCSALSGLEKHYKIKLPRLWELEVGVPLIS